MIAFSLKYLFSRDQEEIFAKQGTPALVSTAEHVLSIINEVKSYLRHMMFIPIDPSDKA